MPSSSGNSTQPPEPKHTGGLAGVFKSLTGHRNAKTPPPAPQNSHAASASVQLAQQLNSSITPRGAIFGGPSNYEKLFQQLKSGSALADRLVAAEALRLAVADYPISGVLSIWYAGKDLISPINSKETRRVGFELLTACVKTGTSTELERKEYFETLSANLDPEDFHLQLSALVELARHGKDLSGFHYEALPLLIRWLDSVFQSIEKARANTSAKSTQSKQTLSEENNLDKLFEFTINVIKFNFNISAEDETGHLIDRIIFIAQHTRTAGTLRSCVRVLDAIITYGAIPSQKLEACVKTLCSIHVIVQDVRVEAWQTMSNLCKSHNGQNTVVILLEALQYPERNAEKPDNVRDVRGAVSILEKVIGECGQDGFPIVPFALLMDALAKSLVIDNMRVELDELRLISSLFSDKPATKNYILEEDWTVMLEIVNKCSARTIETSDGRPVEPRYQVIGPVPSISSADEMAVNTKMNPAQLATSMAQILYGIINRIEQLLVTVQPNDFLQREACILFFACVPAHLPESCAKLVIDFYTEFRFCYPSDPNWKSNISVLHTAFLSNQSRPTQVRLQALKAITDVYEMVELIGEGVNTETNYNFVAEILENITEEKDISVLQDIVTFAVAVSDKAEPKAFEYIIQQLHSCVISDRPKCPPSPTSSRTGGISGIDFQLRPLSPANIVARSFVQIFMRAMDTSTTKALRVFDEILWIAKSASCETDARLSAIKMLFRLRADWAYRIFLTPFTQSEGLASSLYRTPASLARKQATDEAQQSRSSRADEARISRSISASHSNANPSTIRTASGVSRTLQHYHQMWTHPDPAALPEPTAEKASTLLVSSLDESDCEGVGPAPGKKLLKINIWLETIIGLLQQGDDWEVYSYAIVHLPSQLTNQALFRAAIPQMKLLRGVICEQIKNSSFHEPPLASGLRKADVAICIFQVLNMVMSYHKHFSRGEEDEIVKTFIHGVGAWERAAKGCIHALSICCHELPASMRSVLVNILLKMSQIITQSHVAVHILEFLATLARLPDLYGNFRDEDYRTVFGICFRYLQYVRDQNSKAAANRNSAASIRHVSTPVESTGALIDTNATESNLLPNTSDDLPQYVFALAYHVITFWFLSLRLSDRAGHVSWITRNLVWTDEMGRQRLDEQADVTLDFMRRTAYANVDESKANPDFTPENYGEILKERWIAGQCIVTVEQARHGHAQITKRQPSGTSHFMIQQKFEPPPAHQVSNQTDSTRDPRYTDTNTVLPGYITVQLVAPLPSNSEAVRPIHLPNDETVQRAISIFDRNSTVDGHKVGVVYIGENQTEETVILANVMGSSDYQHFLGKLGTLTKLQGATFNMQGLDRQYNTDGEFTYCWRDRVTEIVFHVITMMPTNIDHDPQCIGKKKHIGNDFVNIIFNNSGKPFRFDTFPSEFNYVNIIIEPESRASFVATRLRSESYADTAFYKVQVMSKEGFPEISPAAETKILSLRALPEFIRLLALNASVFSHVWANRKGGEHVSSWRNRLREIVRLREKYAPKSGGAPSSFPPSVSQAVASQGNVRDSFQSIRRSSVANFLISAGEHDRPAKAALPTSTDFETETRHGGTEESMVDCLDFSKWA